jgi:hypothetical protein
LIVAPKNAPIVANSITKNIFKLLPSCIAKYAAGGTTISDGNGIKELSIVIKRVIVQ